jgi:hypothetical protein
MSMKFLLKSAGKPVEPPPYELSQVQRTHPWWAYLWPFRSRQEAVVMLRVVSVGLLLSAIAVWLWVAPDALRYTLPGGLIGGLWLGPYRSLPAQMTITTRGEVCHQLTKIQKMVMKIGFVSSAEVTEPAHYHYVFKPPTRPLLRLLYVEGQSFDLRVQEHTIHLQGDVRWIELIHQKLAKQLET